MLIIQHLIEIIRRDGELVERRSSTRQVMIDEERRSKQRGLLLVAVQKDRIDGTIRRWRSLIEAMENDRCFESKPVKGLKEGIGRLAAACRWKEQVACVADNKRDPHVGSQRLECKRRTKCCWDDEDKDVDWIDEP